MVDTSSNIRQRLRPRGGNSGTITSITDPVVVHNSSDQNHHDAIENCNPKDDDDVTKTMSDIQATSTVPLVNASPPFHTIMVYTIMVIVLLYYLPSLQEIDEIATIQMITECKYFSFITTYHIAIYRCTCTILITIVLTQMIYNRKGWYIITPYLKESKLMKHVQHHMIGIKTLYPFTSWSFVILGLYFALSSYVTLHAMKIQQTLTANTTIDDAYHTYNIQHRILLRCTIILWEISATCTILIAVVVRYVMWPAALRRIQEELLLYNIQQEHQKELLLFKTNELQQSPTVPPPSPPRPSHSLNSYQNLWMHNINVLLALLERCIISGIPVRYNEWTLAPLYGCSYVLFSWNMIYAYNNKQRYGPHFIYFFLDTTLPGYYCSYALLTLLLVLLLFYSLYCSIEYILYSIDHTIVDPFMAFITTNDDESSKYSYLLAHVFVVLFISSFVMRFRD